MFSSFFFLFRGKSGRRKSIGDNFVITRIDCQSAIKPVGSSRKYRWKISGTRSPWIKYSWVRRMNSIWNFHRWIKIKRTFCYSVRITFNLSRALLDNRRWKFIFQGKGYEMKVFVCKKKKKFVRREENPISNSYVVRNFWRKIEEKESVSVWSVSRSKKMKITRRSGSLKDRCAESRLFSRWELATSLATMLFQISCCLFFKNRIFFSTNFQIL